MANLFFSDDVVLNFNCIFGKNTLVVDSLTGSEAISQPYAFTVLVHSLNKEIDCNALMGTNATVSLTIDGRVRYFNGIIGCVEQVDTHEDANGLLYVFYEIQLNPSLWMLKFTQNFYIFQNLRTIDIITAILKSSGVVMNDQTTTAGKNIRSYCVQYGESNFDFMSRLMEEVGISYTFLHTDGAHTLVLMDSTNNAPSVYDQLPMMKAVLGDRMAMNQISYFRRQYNVVPSQYKMADSNYMKPSTQLRSMVKGDGLGGSVYQYPGLFDDLVQGDQYAAKRIQELEWSKQVVFGKSTAPFLGNATTFSLVNYPSISCNRRYLTYEVHHTITRLPLVDVTDDDIDVQHNQAKQRLVTTDALSSQLMATIYSNHFRAIPFDVPFVPLRKTVKPRIHSAQTARVVGPKGEEVYCDYLGRIKVQFYWDTRGSFDENSSCWVRVAQNWAGSGFGGLVIPRVGMEVLVTFIDGDPDRPMVTGCVYHAENVPPTYAANSPTKSAFISHSTGGSSAYNELSFDDALGRENVLLKASRDASFNIANNFTTTIGADMSVSLKGSHRTVLSAGDMDVTLEKGAHSLTLTTGNYKVSLKKGGISIQSAGDVSIVSSGALNLSAATINLSATNSITIKAPQKIAITAGVRVTVDFPGKMATFPM